MKTATTLQLLDANNNNISPAVCVDSLYFEKISDNERRITYGGKTYSLTYKTEGDKKTDIKLTEVTK